MQRNLTISQRRPRMRYLDADGEWQGCTIVEDLLLVVLPALGWMIVTVLVMLGIGALR